MKLPKKMMTFALIALLFIILLQNAQVVTFRLLFLKFSMSQVILVILTTLIGFILGVGAAKSWRI